MMYHPPVVVAEACCNHMGRMDIAHEMIMIAAVFCKVDAVKFQKRCPKELLTPEQYNAPHPVPANSYGKTYGEHREFLEFSLEQHVQLKQWCDELHVAYGSSVWDMTSAQEIAAINPAFIKIPSACNTHFEMLRFLCDEYPGEIHLSLGMTSHAEEAEILGIFEQKNRLQDLVLYACTSGYPVPFSDVCLLDILRIREKYEDKVKAIGFSGHHNGISIDAAAFALGASYIERHFTLNHFWKGTDHLASLEPDPLRRMKRNLGHIYQSLTSKPQEILPIEQVQRDKLKYRPH